MFTKKRLLFLFSLLIFFDLRAQLNWQQTNGPYGGAAYDVKIDSHGNLFAATSGGLYKSTNNGESWHNINYNTTSLSRTEIFIHDSGVLLISGAGSSFKSDTGITHFDYTTPVRSIQMNTSGKLFGISFPQSISYSIDTAKTWKLFTKFESKLNAIHIYQDKYFIAATDSGVYTSSDSGKTWTITCLGKFSGINCDNKGNWFLFSARNILISNDLGKTWNKVITPGEDYYYQMYITQKDEIYLSYAYGLIYSSDLGKDWQNIIPYNYEILGFCEDSYSNLFLATLFSGILKYNPVSKELTIRNEGINAYNIDKLFINKDKIYCKVANKIYKSTDFGSSWTELGISGFAASLLPGSQTKIFATSSGKIDYSSDDGKTVKEILMPSQYDLAIELAVIDDNILVALMYDKFIYRTDNFGKNWEKVFSFTEYIDESTIFTYPNGNILLGVNKTLYQSTDKGKSWQKIKDFTGMINVIKMSPWHQLYVGTTEGLYETDLTEWKNLSVPWNSPYVRDIAFSTSGEMFVLGFKLYSSDDKGITFHCLSSNLYFTFQKYLAVSENNLLFLGTQECGLFKTEYEYFYVPPADSVYTFQNYPNPFNNGTTIEFINRKKEIVTITIYNILGSEIETLVSDELLPGYYKFFWQPKDISSGVYLYRILSPSIKEIRKMIFIK